MNTYYVQDENGEFPGKLAFQQNPPIEPTPSGFIAVTVVPDDERMYWNMVDAWYWPKAGLKKLAIDHLNMLMTSLATINGNQMQPYNLAAYISVAVSAMLEEPAEQRFCKFDNVTAFPSMSNAEAIEAMLALPNALQTAADVYAQVVTLIDGDSIVDAAGLESTWATLSSTAPVRARLPMLSYLAPFTQTVVPDDEAVVVTPDNKRDGATDCYPAAPLTYVTFELPENPRAGQVRQFSSSLAIASLLFTNGTVRNPPTSLEANDNTVLRCTKPRVPEEGLEPAIPAEWIRVH